MRASRITVCVPVFRAGTLLFDTLTSIQRQSYGHFQVLVSIDGGDADSAAVCKRFAADPRFHMIRQGQRLGWVGNANALLAQVATELYCLHPHDDVLHEAYLETLCAHLDREPQAAVAFCDISAQGEIDGRPVVQQVLRQPSVVGNGFERLCHILRNDFAAVAWRGLTRTRALCAAGAMRSNEADDFAADTVWMAQLARAGELHRVAEPLYTKRYHDAMTHMRWRKWPIEQKLRAWAVHCHELLAVAAPTASGPGEHLELWRSAMWRLQHVGVLEIGLDENVERLLPTERRVLRRAFARRLLRRAFTRSSSRAGGGVRLPCSP